MERALLLIGVARSGLPELPAVAEGIRAMQRWANSQGYRDDLVVTLSDDRGSPVRIADVFDAASAIACRLTVEQLIVYFCGHGVYNDGSDLWLLSGSPQNANEAVNVAKTIRFASRGTIPYVVLISDACRSATTTVQMNELAGAPVFPSPAVAGRNNDVDFFAACRLEDVASQVAEPDDPAKFHAVYSEVVAEALEGNYTSLLELIEEGDGPSEVVRPHPLRDALPGLVAMRVDELGKTATVNQVPVATLTWNPKRWISRLAVTEATPRRGGDADTNWLSTLPTVEDPARSAAARAEERLVRAPVPSLGGPAILRVVGDELSEAYSPDADLMPEGEALRVLLHDGNSATTVVVALSAGRCAVVPAFRDRLVTLTVENDRLIDLRYQPLAPSGGVPAEQSSEESFQAVRARVAAATRFGLPWWQEESAEGLLEQWHDAVLTDPAFEVYLAYALARFGRDDLVAELLRSHQDSVAVYDVALLAEDFTVPYVPSLPLLSRGWSLLGPDGVAARPDLPVRMPSPWTLFSNGFERLQEYVDREGAP
jgi:hypothetical protein